MMELKFETQYKKKRIQRVGGSMCILIPKTFKLKGDGIRYGLIDLENLGWRLNEKVEINLINDNEIRVKLIKKQDGIN